VERQSLQSQSLYNPAAYVRCDLTQQQTGHTVAMRSSNFARKHSRKTVEEHKCLAAKVSANRCLQTHYSDATQGLHPRSHATSRRRTVTS
jgi:hypothetical protein